MASSEPADGNRQSENKRGSGPGFLSNESNPSDGSALCDPSSSDSKLPDVDPPVVKRNRNDKILVMQDSIRKLGLDRTHDPFSRMNKQDWICEIDRFKTVTRFAIRGGMLSHWVIHAQTDTLHYVRAEIVTLPGHKLDEHEVKNSNELSFEPNQLYVVPRALISIEPAATPDSATNMPKDDGYASIRASEMQKIDPPVEWNDFLVAICCDPKVYTAYDEIHNNCQHFCNRVCNHLGLRPRKTVTDHPKARDALEMARSTGPACVLQ